MFNWEDYLKLSKDWKDIDNQDPLSEAFYRSAISRAYYFVYHYVKEFAKCNGYTEDPKRSGDRHREMIDFLNMNKRNTSASYLSKLLKYRKECDYINNKIVDQRLVNSSLYFITEIVADINTYSL